MRGKVVKKFRKWVRNGSFEFFNEASSMKSRYNMNRITGEITLSEACFKKQVKRLKNLHKMKANA